jgi:hypothetical protein
MNFYCLIIISWLFLVICLSSYAQNNHVGLVAKRVLVPVTPQNPNGLDSLCMLSELHLPPSHLCFRPRFA